MTHAPSARRLLTFLLLLLALALVTPASPWASAGEDSPGEPAMGEPGAAGADATDPDDEDSATPEALKPRIVTALEKGIAWLKSRQLPTGSWGIIEGDSTYQKVSGNTYKEPAGPTALALYALLKCKVPENDPVIRRGFDYLRKNFQKPGSVYEVSMVLLAVTATADPFKRHTASEGAGDKVKLGGAYRSWAQELTQTLVKRREKKKLLGWRYQIEWPGVNMAPAPGGEQDLSCTQLASLALLSAERAGIKVPSALWNDLITFAMQQQEDDGPEWDRAVYDRPATSDKPPPGGTDPNKYAKPEKKEDKPKDRARGFSYIKKEGLPAHEMNPTGSMTACGLSLILTSRYVLNRRNDPLWMKRPDQDTVRQSLYDGLAWLDANWSPFQNPQAPGLYAIYYLYCSERAFDLAGNLKLGPHFWYAEMAEQLVNRQDPKGFWNTKTTLRPYEVLDTSFALLFLKRATRGGIPFPSLTDPGSDTPPVDNRGR